MLVVTAEQFDAMVQRALGRIPPVFRKAMDNIMVSVELRPSPELLTELGMAPDEPLFGVYEGIPLTERSITAPPLYPDRIILFQEPLQAFCHTRDELEREVEVTVVHELAHYLGMGEEELNALGYG